MVLSPARPVRMEWILRGYGGIGERGEPLGEAPDLSGKGGVRRVRASMPKPEGLEERLKVAGDGIPVYLL
jgi:hypothetical protein